MMATEYEKITAWVTKRALTSGIEKIDGKFSYRYKDAFFYGVHGSAYGDEWHRTEAEAVARAEQMRVNRIASLEKQIAKLKKLSFTVGG